MMSMQTDRLTLVQQYEAAPEAALFTQVTVAAVRDCSLATIERDRWAGTGVPFIKLGRAVRYRKSDIRDWIDQYQTVQSTTQAQMLANKISGEKHHVH
ncbi:MAG: hypothetical protein K0R98_1055 [Rickettsiaceae bacterium]|nr:hypothetical protein [Rickettsiaceae bacterium]